jgi:hypothetical protein
MNPQRGGRQRRWLAGVCLLAVLTAAGCGAKTASVTGKVSFRNKALTTGTVSFYGNNGDIVSGLIAPDGTYRLHEVGPGPVRVVVVSHPAVPPGLQANRAPAGFAPSYPASRGEQRAALATMSKPSTPIPERYNRPDSSGLSFVVNPGEQTLNLELAP